MCVGKAKPGFVTESHSNNRLTDDLRHRTWTMPKAKGWSRPVSSSVSTFLHPRQI